MSFKTIYETDSKAISFDPFCINNDQSPESTFELLFQPPNRVIRTASLDSSNNYINFTISSSEFIRCNSAGKEIHHIAEYLKKFHEHSINLTGKILLIHLADHVAFLFGKRINDYLVTRIVHFNSAEELLYHIVCTSNSINIQGCIDTMILSGNIAPESKITKLITVYYPQIIIKGELNIFELMNS
jgi:hypothetical protein